MTLADLPRRVVMPLGDWPKPSPKVKKLERWKRYRDNNRARRAEAERERRRAA